MADADIPFHKCKFSIGSVSPSLHHFIFGSVSTFKYDDAPMLKTSIHGHSHVMTCLHLKVHFGSVFQIFHWFSFLPPHQVQFQHLSMAMLNSFALLTFDKTVILEVSRMGTINLALRPDVYCIILQSLEVLSRLKACFFYAMDA